MEYKQNLFFGTREELLGLVQKSMSEKRFHHVLGVEKAAIQLAKQVSFDEEKASIAALVHDYAKERSDAEFLKMIDEKGYDSSLIPFGNNIWHGVVGVEFIQQELGIHDAEILHAVSVHTTGSAEMSQLDKILYVADYIEEGRSFPVVEEARRIAKLDLDEAVAFETEHTLSYLINQKVRIYPLTIETYNATVVK
ncbi:MAG: bis(5'-nucleosyl)-tetraphosphatase (symmetrical) YqeK [Streptococcaceae bacterium]|jgi:predicted HD superfamily hydrolase involved in NAD metabolism|nr:bis(5'-nucleosyl)-tetraphosphatase (symmetrical) YqeK [Streptococcaceae bacterium]